MAAIPNAGVGSCSGKGGTNQHLFVLFLLILFPSLLWAQGTKEDYLRAESFKKKVEGKVFNTPYAFQWLEKENKFWYINNTPQGKEFVLVDADKQTRKPAFDQAKLAKGLATASGKPVEPYNLPFSTIEFLEGGKMLEFEYDDKRWQYILSTSKLVDKGKVEPKERPNRYWGAGANELNNKPVVSPDGKWLAFIKNFNVYIKDNASGEEEYQLSYDGSEGEYYSSFFSWSPDSKKLATNKVRPNKEHLIYFVESSPEDQLQPKLHSRNYLKPGDALPQRAPQLFLVEDKKQLDVDASLLEDQYNLTYPVWRKDSRGFTFEYNQRGHQAYRVLEVEASTGKVKELISEESKTFIDYSGKKYRYDVADGKEIIWASERDGWNHLYLYDGTTGKVKSQITKGEWVVRRVVHVDELKRKIILEGSGKEQGQDPYLIQYYSVNFDGTGLTALTTEDANHKAVFSPDFTYFVDTYSKVDLPPTTVLRSAADGKIVMELEQADATALLAAGWKAPEVFTAKGRDGKTDIWGIIVRPSNFDPAKQYPVIEYIYAGPHSSFVPKTYNPNSRFMHELAELGFVVVQMDGMGTSNRSKAFHDVCWKNLKDGGFPDRIAWMKAAAQKYSYLDLNRVGIFGTSAGGQSSAGALLFHPEFYKVAVSSAGCHDNRMDKIWWNEQWMGKIGPHYAESSNVVNAHKLQGKLMLILGELDDNVDPASTLQVVNALIKANKNFDFLMVPGMGHSSGGDYGERKRRDFFVKHLLSIDPPAWENSDSPARATGGAIGMTK
ncbi:S9 family peptidase [Pontibacter sp. SGAir0037]|uniref:S9 family peptidase n=1 Tax=Pontibacter sp. SGAir0037 TaxID=2571030 RepID=UPI0010CCBCC2|nr:S9 family peptidase [Pontibacter sp. SGAir0037]QCR22293.1 S9 family peptidase [Pontibacter sp. SGAir0037]